MFDEVGELTAMFKLRVARAGRPPSGLLAHARCETRERWRAIGICGRRARITRVFHGQSKASSFAAFNPGPPGPGTPPLSVQNGAQFRRGLLAAEAIGTAYAIDVPLPDDATLTIIDSSGAGRTASCSMRPLSNWISWRPRASRPQVHDTR